MLLELSLRFLVFHPSALAKRLGAPLRQPGWYADPIHGTDYWKLEGRFQPISVASRPVHPELGWIQAPVDPTTYAHDAFDQLDGRRPILLYGASFARGTPANQVHFQDLLAASDLGDEYLILNYGMSGYGIDQTLLLFERSIGHYLGLDPVVVISFNVNSDLDRAWFDFRQAPKPRFPWTDGGIGAVEYPGHSSIAQYLDRNPPAIRSYALALFRFGTDLVPKNWRVPQEERARIRHEKERLARGILERTWKGVAAADVLGFFLLFHSETRFRPAVRHDWREATSTTYLDELGAPYVTTAGDLEAAVERAGSPISDYYIQSGAGVGHPNDASLPILFESLCRGLRGEYDGSAP